MELSAPTELKLTQRPSTTLPLSPICLLLALIGSGDWEEMPEMSALFW